MRCMYRRGITTIANYLDDFILFGNSPDQCLVFQRVLIRLLCSLGFRISWHKCTSPSQSVRYLGVIFDSSSLELRLPLDKLQALRAELEYFQRKTRATRHQLQRLCGLVAHAAKLIRGGRTFSRRLIDRLAKLTDNRRVRLGPDFRLDVEWWLQFSYQFNGVTKRVLSNNGDGMCCYTDASASGYGMYCGMDWQAGYFGKGLPRAVSELNSSHEHWQNYEVEEFPERDRNINFLELVLVILAVRRWKNIIANRHLICYSDNTQVQSCVNKGVSINHSCMTLLRQMFWDLASINAHVTIRHVSGANNNCADMLSRIGPHWSGEDLLTFGLCCRITDGDRQRDVSTGGEGLVYKHARHEEFAVEKLH